MAGTKPLQATTQEILAVLNSEPINPWEIRDKVMTNRGMPTIEQSRGYEALHVILSSPDVTRINRRLELLKKRGYVEQTTKNNPFGKGEMPFYSRAA